jgi:hypothetical protein
VPSEGAAAGQSGIEGVAGNPDVRRLAALYSAIALCCSLITLLAIALYHDPGYTQIGIQAAAIRLDSV